MNQHLNSNLATSSVNVLLAEIYKDNTQGQKLRSQHLSDVLKEDWNECRAEWRPRSSATAWPRMSLI